MPAFKFLASNWIECTIKYQCDGVNSGLLGLQVQVEVGLLGVRALVAEKSWKKIKTNKKHFNRFWYTMVTVKVEDGQV